MARRRAASSCGASQLPHFMVTRVIIIFSFDLTVEARESGNSPINSNVTVRIVVQVSELFVASSPPCSHAYRTYYSC